MIYMSGTSVLHVGYDPGIDRLQERHIQHINSSRLDDVLAQPIEGCTYSHANCSSNGAEATNRQLRDTLGDQKRLHHSRQKSCDSKQARRACLRFGPFEQHAAKKRSAILFGCCFCCLTCFAPKGMLVALTILSCAPHCSGVQSSFPM